MRRCLTPFSCKFHSLQIQFLTASISLQIPFLAISFPYRFKFICPCIFRSLQIPHFVETDHFPSICLSLQMYFLAKWGDPFDIFIGWLMSQVNNWLYALPSSWLIGLKADFSTGSEGHAQCTLLWSCYHIIFAQKVTAGRVESNSSLAPGWLITRTEGRKGKVH